MDNISWDGSNPKEKRNSCPYSVDFVCKPSPANSLNSLESGRLLLTVYFQEAMIGAGAEDAGDGDDDGHAFSVESASAKIINNAKKENIDKVQGTSHLKYQTSISAELSRDVSSTTNISSETGDLTNNNNGSKEKWIGEISIPSSWVEGGTRTYEKTGSAPPKSNTKLFTLEISYNIGNQKTCTACFNSGDVFHWHPTMASETKM
jgi:hypothetical protein